MNPTSRAHRAASSLLLISALCTAAAQTIAADPAIAPAAGAHPITGKWIWKLHSNACTETLQFRGDGRRVGASGNEVTEGQYQITPKPSLLGFYRLSETLTVANGQRDCSGDLHAVDEGSLTRYVQFSPRHDLLIVCKTESLQACYGPLRRVAE
jgi:hypothetical protein